MVSATNLFLKMERYGQVLLIAIPFFLVLIAIEKIYGLWRGEDRTPLMDSVSSISSGITNAVKDVLGLSISILSYSWMVKNWAIFQVESSWWVYLFVFIVLDFQGYWTHRWAHEINFFWNKHLIHHSSEEFNLPCALRQSVSSFVNLFTFFLLPCALVGVPTVVVATLAPIHLFAQFWYHTRHIGRMGFLEKIIVTPSHHRVHHALNGEYLDKNYSQIFIVWDKWFGTFQEELADVPPVYGITRPAATWNPIKINFQHLFLLARDAFFTKNWWDKLRIWWMPTGWRPDDVAEKFPVQKIGDAYYFEKYSPPSSPILRAWSVFQLVATLLFASFFFARVAEIGVPGIFYYGFFLFLTVYSFTDLMDGRRSAAVFEFVRVVFGFCLIWFGRGWFDLDQFLAGSSAVVAVYFLVSLAMSIWLSTIAQNTRPETA